SQVQTLVRDALGNVEQRLREDPQFLADVKAFVLETAQGGTLSALLEPVLASLRREAERELNSDSSHFLALALRQIDDWVARRGEDGGLRGQRNAWCRRRAVQLMEKHPSLVGARVEEQMNRLSDDKLTELIQAKVGEDLNWIRLNGSFVGGLVGAGLYLMF